MRFIAIFTCAALLLIAGAAGAQQLDDGLCGDFDEVEVAMFGKNGGLAWMCKPTNRSSVYGVQGACGFAGVDTGVCIDDALSSCVSDLDCYFSDAGLCAELECRGGDRDGLICDPDKAGDPVDGCPLGVCDVRVGTCECVGGSPGVIWQGFNTIVGKVNEDIGKNQVKFDGKQKGKENSGEAPGLLVTVVDIVGVDRVVEDCFLPDPFTKKADLKVNAKSKDLLTATGKGKGKWTLDGLLACENVGFDFLAAINLYCDKNTNPFSKVVKVGNDLKDVKITVSGAQGVVDIND